MTGPIDAASLSQLFHDARSRNGWKDEVLPDQTWHDLYDLLKHAPTSMNASPARFVFVTSAEAKARLVPLMMEANRPKTQAAPGVVIIGTDTAFYEKLPELFPARPQAKDMFATNAALSEITGFRNSTLQGGYLILAARALGLDVGPMSGFDNAGVDAEFFAGTTIKSNFICNIGHAVDEAYPRLPRLSFEDACQIV